MSDKEKNFDFFKSIGIQEWLLDGDEQFGTFFGWLAENITDENILSKEELAERDYLIKKGKYLNDVELKCEIETVAAKYGGIWDFTDQDVLLLKHEINQLKVQNEVYDDLIDQATQARVESNAEIAVLKNDMNKLELQEKKIIDKCTSQIDLLSEKCAENQNNIQQLAESYTKTTKYPLFMHQMQLESYYDECDIFNKYVETYMRNNFKIIDQEGNNLSSATDLESSCIDEEELTQITDRLYNANLAFYSDKMSAEAQQTLIDSLKNKQFVYVTKESIKNDIEMMRIQYEQDYSLETKRLSNELQLKLMKITKQETEMVIYENNKEKLERAKKRKENVQQFHDIISGSLLNAELVWALMQLDIHRVKRRNDFDYKLNEYRTETQLCNLRMAKMKTLEKSNDSELYNYMVSQLNSIMYENSYKASMQSKNLNMNIFNDINAMEATLARCFETLSNPNLNGNKNAFMKLMASIEKPLSELLRDGPTNHYQFWNMDLLKKKAIVEIQNEDISKKMKKLKEEMQQYNQDWNTNDFWRYKQILWIWFLTEPMKLLKAIKATKANAQKQEKPKTEKMVSGLLRKDN